VPAAACLNVAGDLLRRGILLLDGRGNRRGDLGDAPDGLADFRDRGDGVPGSSLDRRDRPAISSVALAVWLRATSPRGDDGEALARLTSRRRFDRHPPSEPPDARRIEAMS